VEIDLSKIDKKKFTDALWISLHDMAFKDIERAAAGGSKMGAFILSACYIDYLAGFRYGKPTRGKDYIKFTKKYLPSKYIAPKLYTDLRCKLVHNYSEGGTYLFTDGGKHPHMSRSTNDSRIFINLEDFIVDINSALERYFKEILANDKLLKLAIKRYQELGIIGIVNL
jgi:hypothetical protein